MIDDTRLSQLATRWTLLARAHAADESDAQAARAEFLPRYCAPVLRYLHGILGDADLSEELAQEFALRFVRGDFRNFRPERGRFRDYLKASLRHLVHEWRRRPKTEESLPPDSRLLLRTPARDESDEAAFIDIWRGELINRVWSALERESMSRDQRYYEALRLKAEDPSRKSAAVAELLTARGPAVSADATRQMLFRARARFAALLRDEIAMTIGTDEPAAVDEELADLALLAYCKHD